VDEYAGRVIALSVVDAFVSKPFSGNPAAVCQLPTGMVPTDRWRQQVAAELNLSETAFVSLRPDGGWDLRWFTPVAEVNLCGHATLASAHALWETGRAPQDQPLRFHTRSGWLTCTRRSSEIAMDFPAQPPVAGALPEGLLAALRLTAAEVRWAGRAAEDAFLELSTEAAVRAVRPDFAALAGVPLRGVIVCARSEAPGVDFVSRFFAPRVGIAEDPVTGSAHCALAVHWSRRLGRTTLRAWQASARGGAVGMELDGERVTLLGRATTAWRGEWLVPPDNGNSAAV